MFDANYDRSLFNVVTSYQIELKVELISVFSKKLQDFHMSWKKA